MKDTKIEVLTKKEKELYLSAIKARNNAYAPYSKFRVGAAVRCHNGTIYSSCNIENASYGLCCCAERNAVFAAIGAGNLAIEDLLVVADTTLPVSPCGACRQVMNEFKIKKIYLANLQGMIKICTLEELLPYGFSL